jgi:cell division protein FtsL
MQAAPNVFGQVPYRPHYPQDENLHPSRQPLPQRKIGAGSNSLFGFLLLAVAVLSVLAVVNLSFRAVNTESGYRLQRIKNEIAQNKADQERLKLDIARLTSPERIQRVAIEKLAMTVPEEISFLSLPNGKTSPKNFAYVSQKEER